MANEVLIFHKPLLRIYPKDITKDICKEGGLKDVRDSAEFNNKICKQNEFPTIGTAEVKMY